MWCSKTFRYIVFIMTFVIYGCSAQEQITLKGEQYIIYKVEGNEVEAGYLYYHLKKRTLNSTNLVLQATDQSENVSPLAKRITLVIDPLLEQDYCIKNSGAALDVQVRDTRTMKWLVYQLIDAISKEDNRFDTSDLPPAILAFETGCYTHDFVYREPYYRGNLEIDQSGVLGNHNVELDWGIWGHNLSKILEGNNDSSVYARIDGQINKEQYCFTSPVLKDVVTAYIVDNFGEEEAFSFVITPQDNDLICGCESCTKRNAGRKDAAESVAFLVNQLASRFVKHQFFTLMYRTTSEVPTTVLEKNVGVLISTIDIPKGIDLQSAVNHNKGVQRWVRELEQWKAKTTLLYIWDYSANFDDYLTPIPVLYSLQKQLQFYKKMGVTGVFLNGSGYDYSSFEGVKNYVASALMKDVNLSVEQLITQYFQKFYPTYGAFLAAYYMKLETRFELKNMPYPLYGSMQEIAYTYLDIQDFMTFYSQLETLVQAKKGQEYELLRKLYIGLTFTRMQLAYNQGIEAYGVGKKQGHKVVFNSEISQWISLLKEAKKYNIVTYKEVGGGLDDYIKQWDTLFVGGSYENLLLNTGVDVLSKKDEGADKSALLNNGLKGLYTDYHLGWYISSEDDLHVSFDTSKLLGKKNIALSFLVLQKHRFEAPEYIEFWLDGVLVHTVKKEFYEKTTNIAKCKISVDFTASKNMQIKAFKVKTRRVALACDEIQITN